MKGLIRVERSLFSLVLTYVEKWTSLYEISRYICKLSSPNTNPKNPHFLLSISTLFLTKTLSIWYFETHRKHWKQRNIGLKVITLHPHVNFYESFVDIIEQFSSWITSFIQKKYYNPLTEKISKSYSLGARYLYFLLF